MRVGCLCLDVLIPPIYGPEPEQYDTSIQMQWNAPVTGLKSEHQLTNGNPILIRLDENRFEFVGVNISEHFMITFDPSDSRDMDIVFLSGAVEAHERH